MWVARVTLQASIVQIPFVVLMTNGIQRECKQVEFLVIFISCQHKLQ